MKLRPESSSLFSKMDSGCNTWRRNEAKTEIFDTEFLKNTVQ